MGVISEEIFCIVLVAPNNDINVLFYINIYLQHFVVFVLFTEVKTSTVSLGDSRVSIGGGVQRSILIKTVPHTEQHPYIL